MIQDLGPVWTFAIGKPATPAAVAKALTAAGITGATIIPGIGLWQGQRERSVIVRIAGMREIDARRLARDLRHTFKQDAVYFEGAGRAYLSAA